MPKLIIIDKRPLEYAFRDNGQATGNNNYTVSGLSFGPADDDRYIVVGIGHAATPPTAPLSVVIGGVTATPIVFSSTGATNRGTGLYYAKVPTGTSGSVVVSYSANFSRTVNVFVYSILPQASVASFAVDGDGVSIPVTLTASLNVPATGVVIGVAQANSTSRNATWTNLTEDFESTGDETGTCASAQFSSAQTGLAVQVNFSAASTGAAAWAVFEP